MQSKNDKPSLLLINSVIQLKGYQSSSISQTIISMLNYQMPPNKQLNWMEGFWTRKQGKLFGDKVSENKDGSGLQFIIMVFQWKFHFFFSRYLSLELVCLCVSRFLKILEA